MGRMNTIILIHVPEIDLLGSASVYPAFGYLLGMNIEIDTDGQKSGEKPMNNNPTSTQKISNSLPSWVFCYGCFLAILGIVAGLLGITSPTKFFSDFPNFTQWGEISYITASWGVRSLTMGVAMLIALWVKMPSAIGVVFSMRFLTEIGDLLNTLATGHGSMGLPLGVVAIVWVVVFLIPEALAVRWGLAKMRTLKR